PHQHCPKRSSRRCPRTTRPRRSRPFDAGKATTSRNEMPRTVKAVAVFRVEDGFSSFERHDRRRSVLVKVRGIALLRPTRRRTFEGLYRPAGRHLVVMEVKAGITRSAERDPLGAGDRNDLRVIDAHHMSSVRRLADRHGSNLLLAMVKMDLVGCDGSRG